MGKYNKKYNDDEKSKPSNNSFEEFQKAFSKQSDEELAESKEDQEKKKKSRFYKMFDRGVKASEMSE